jgi:hypothetical protein
MLRRLFGLVVLLVVIAAALYLWRGRPAGSPDLRASAQQWTKEARQLGAEARDKLGPVGRKIADAAGSVKTGASTAPTQAPSATASTERAAAAQRALRSNANVARFDLAVRQEGDRLVLRGHVGTLAEKDLAGMLAREGAGVPLDNLVEVRAATP